MLRARYARPLERATAWASLAATCSIDWYDVAHDRIDLAAARAELDFAGALLAAGYPLDCRNQLKDLVTPYSSGLRAGGERVGSLPDDAALNLAGRADALDQRCANAFERRLPRFRPATCGDPRTAGCFSVVDGGGAVEETPAGHDAAPIVRRASAGPLADEGFSCALDTISVAHRAGRRYLRVGTRGIARMCGGGTAASTLDAIYEIRGRRLVLVADDSVRLH